MYVCVFGLHALVFLHVYSHILFLFVYVVYVHPVDVHVGESRTGVGGEEGGAGPFAAAGASGSGQCGLCRSCDGRDLHLPLATGAPWVSVRPTCLVQHRGETKWRTQRTWASEQKTGKSADISYSHFMLVALCCGRYFLFLEHFISLIYRFFIENN